MVFLVKRFIFFFKLFVILCNGFFMFMWVVFMINGNSFSKFVEFFFLLLCLFRKFFVKEKLG